MAILHVRRHCFNAFCSKVTLIHRRDTCGHRKLWRIERSAMKNRDSLERCLKILADDKGFTRAIRVADRESGDTREIKCKGAFIAIGHIPNTDFSDGLLRRDPDGYIVPIAGSQVKTSIEGLFAAGDCVDHVYRQAITAAGMGCQAAIEAERWLAER